MDEKTKIAMAKTLRMLGRMVFGLASVSVQETEEDLYLWKCFIKLIKDEIGI